MRKVGLGRVALLGLTSMAAVSFAALGAVDASANPKLAIDGCSGSIVNVSGPGNQAKVYCSKSNLGGSQFRAIAQCVSGNFVYGPWKPNASSSQTSTCYTGVRGTFGQGYYYEVRG